jgi:hypothetical protein
MYILVGTVFCRNILLITQYRYWLRTISSTFCRWLKLEKCVIHSLKLMSDLFIWIYSGEGGARRAWNIVKGGASSKISGTSVLGTVCFDNNDDPVVRLCLWTAAINGPIVHPPCDTWAWKTHDELYRQLLIRPPELSGNSTSSPLVASRRNWRRKLLIYPLSLSNFEHVVKCCM